MTKIGYVQKFNDESVFDDMHEVFSTGFPLALYECCSEELKKTQDILARMEVLFYVILFTIMWWYSGEGGRFLV